MGTLKEDIKKILAKSPGLRARIIAALLRVDSGDVNRVLHPNKGIEFFQDSNWGWHLIGSNKKAYISDNKQIVSPINTIHGIVSLLFEEDESVFDYENVSEANKEGVLIYHLDTAIACFYFDIVLNEEEYEYLTESEYDEFFDEFGSLLSPRIQYSDFEDKFSGFYTRTNEFPIILKFVTSFDLKYHTNYAEMIINCFTLLGHGIVCSLEIDVINETPYQDHVDAMKKYIESKKEYTKLYCENCGDEIEDGEEIEHEGITYCPDCYENLDDEDDEDDLDDEDEVESQEEDIEVDEEDLDDEEENEEKDEITEDCSTCKNKRVCPKAKFNLLCDMYVYTSKP